MKRLGIIGGMGPAATARLFARIVASTDAARDQDHLDIRITNNPAVPDRTAFLLGQKGARDFVPMLQQEAAELEALGCEVLAMPCNTAHAGYNAVCGALERAQLMNMLEEASKRAANLGCTNVGVLATNGTVSCHVYQDALEKQGLGATVPAAQEQEQVMQAIYGYVKAGRPIPDGHLERVFDTLIAAGCDGLLLGCTELTFASPAGSYHNIPVIDALDVLAWRCVQECGAPAKEL